MIEDIITITEFPALCYSMGSPESKMPRSVRVWYDAEPLPQPRQNYNTRWGTSITAIAAKRYNVWRATFRDVLDMAMSLNNIDQFGKVPLKLKAEFTFARTMRRCDLSNCIKALEDCLNGTLITDDRWIDEIDANRVEGKYAAINFQVSELTNVTIGDKIDSK